MTTPSQRVGTVYLVGAGPGDPGLITSCGIEALRNADVVLYDYLVNPVLTAHADESAELICLGQHGTTRIWKQDQINQRMIEEALAGRQVVRLKSGDPSVFGRLSSEVECLASHKIPYVIVPGISAALAAAAYAEIPVTHRDYASAVAFVTGHEAEGKQETAIDFGALAKFPGTLVIYMGVTTAETWTQALMQGGMASETPVALVRKCSLPEQAVIQCQLNEVVSRVVPYSRFPPPVIAIVGEVARRHMTESWFSSKPLFGKTVLVTRPAQTGDELHSALAAQGARVIAEPAICVKPVEDWSQVDEAIAALPSQEWVIFCSGNGVRSFCDRVWALDLDARQFGGTKIAAVGPGTAKALGVYGLKADVVPTVSRAEALQDALGLKAGSKCILVRASRGRDVLRKQLELEGVVVQEVVAYRSVDVLTGDEAVHQAMERGSIDWVTITSSAIARSVNNLYGPALQHAKLVSISPITSDTLRELGLQVAAEAVCYTMPGIVDAIVKAESNQR